MHRDVGERRHGGAIFSLPFQKGEAVEKSSFHNSIMGDFMAYRDRLETNLYRYSGTQQIYNDFL